VRRRRQGRNWICGDVYAKKQARSEALRPVPGPFGTVYPSSRRKGKQMTENLEDARRHYVKPFVRNLDVDDTEAKIAFTHEFTSVQGAGTDFS
jgi:hypothetical protein